MPSYFALYGQNRIILGTDRERGHDHRIADMVPLKKTSRIVTSIVNKDALALIRQLPEYFFITKKALDALRIELIDDGKPTRSLPLHSQRTDKHDALLITLKGNTCHQVYTMAKSQWDTKRFNDHLAFLIDYSDAKNVAISLDVLITHGPQYYLK